MGIVRDGYNPDDPMGSNRFHKTLVFTDNMQKLPVWAVGAILGGLAASLLLTWGSPTVSALYLVFALVNWLALWLLPRTGRSYGPDRPSALALAALNAALLHVLALFRLPEAAALLILIPITGLAIYATWIEPFRLGVTRQTLAAAHMKTNPHPLRILHLGDLHLEHITPRERQLQKFIDQLQPDLILFSGDFVNISFTDDPITHDEIRAVIGQWRAPYGVYCVPGTYTVEPLERVQSFTQGMDHLRLLLDEWVTIPTPHGTVHLCGMVTRHILESDRETLSKLAAQMPAGDGLRVLLTHAPDMAYDADAAGFNLYLCGHTHGGQIRFPVIGAIFTGSHLGQTFAMGRRDLKEVTVYTTRGIGLEGLGAPRARFLCPPEIILWEITQS